MSWLTVIVVGVGVLLLGWILAKSLKYIGPTEVGLVTKRFGRKLSEDSRCWR